MLCNEATEAHGAKTEACTDTSGSCCSATLPAAIYLGIRNLVKCFSAEAEPSWKLEHTRKMQRLQRKSQCAVEEKLVSRRQSVDSRKDSLRPNSRITFTLPSSMCGPVGGGDGDFWHCLDLDYCNFCSSATKIDVLQMKRQKVCPQLDQDNAEATKGAARLRKQRAGKGKRLKNGKMCMAKEKHWRAQSRRRSVDSSSHSSNWQRQRRNEVVPEGWPKYFTDCVQTSIQSWSWRRRRRRSRLRGKRRWHRQTIFGDCTRCKVSTADPPPAPQTPISQIYIQMERDKKDRVKKCRRVREAKRKLRIGSDHWLKCK